MINVSFPVPNGSVQFTKAEAQAPANSQFRWFPLNIYYSFFFHLRTLFLRTIEPFYAEVSTYLQSIYKFLMYLKMRLRPSFLSRLGIHIILKFLSMKRALHVIIIILSLFHRRYSLFLFVFPFFFLVHDKTFNSVMPVYWMLWGLL